MSLHGYLIRQISLCLLPLMLVAVYLAIDNVRDAQSRTDLEAANLAKNFATAIDHNLTARIDALEVLAASPLADKTSHWKELYQEAQGFRQNFGSHVILADVDTRMLFNTRAPFGTTLPMMPRPGGRNAVAIAMATGQAAVGNILIGPVARQPLVAIAVPGLRNGKTAFLLVATFELHQFQNRLEQVALPSGWSLALLDGKDATIARRAPPGLNSATDVDASARFVVKSAVAPWSVVLEIPREVYREPLFTAASVLVIAIVAATLAGVLGGMLSSRRLGSMVASLAQPAASAAPPPKIAEIAAVRHLLEEAAQKRVSAETAGRESEKRFRVTFEQAAVGIAMVAPDGRWLQVNQKLCDIVGYSHDELLAKTFQDVTHPDDLDADLSRLRQVLAGEIETYSMEKRYLHKHGAVVWINLTVAIVRRSDGSPDYFASVIEDIQRRKEAETALKASEAALTEAQHLAGVGNWSWDLRSGRHVWSEEIYLIYGRDPSLPPAVYPEVQSYFAPDSWARLAAAVETALAQGTHYACDAEVVRADGSRRWITARGRATRIADGAVVELHGTVQDITERKAAEEKIRQLNIELEQRVIERTAQLEAANTELETFSYSVSHDLRAPLRSIDGFAKVLEEDYAARLDAEGKDALHRVRAAAQRMGELIDDLLTLSRLSRADIDVESLDLCALARAVADDLTHAEPARNVTFEMPAKLEARGDRRLLAVLLDNLLRNAWKFTGKHARARIELGLTQHEGKPAYFVRDDGAGFDTAHAANLFAPFQRLHSISDFPGTGIGLATVRRIVQRHGGRVWADAAIDRGATIYFTLPA